MMIKILRKKYSYFGHHSCGFIADYFGEVGNKVEVGWFIYLILKLTGYKVTREKISKLISTTHGYFCTECKQLCSFYEQGLSCSCDKPWETEVMDKKDYPEKWVKVTVEVKEQS